MSGAFSWVSLCYWTGVWAHWAFRERGLCLRRRDDAACAQHPSRGAPVVDAGPGCAALIRAGRGVLRDARCLQPGAALARLPSLVEAGRQDRGGRDLDDSVRRARAISQDGDGDRGSVSASWTLRAA